jgi:hypothetical protein
MAYVATLNRGKLFLQTNRMMTRRLRRIMNDVQRDAKIFARGPYSGRGTGPSLAQSIEVEGPVPLGTKVTSTVGSRLPYAASVELGAKIHPIWPKGAPHVYRFFGAGYNAPPKLKFYWRGRLVYTPQVPMAASTFFVSHPGQKGKRYLTKALAKAAIKYRMHLILYEV